jgi:ATP-binding protein involved in chromosome partitioning
VRHPSEEQVREALRQVVDPRTGRDIVTAGLISGLGVRDGTVAFTIEVDPRQGAAMEPVRKAAEDAVYRLPGVSSVSAMLTAHRAAPESQQRSRPARPHPGVAAEKPLIPGVRAIVAVASGKGGVGKSTVAVNLALGLLRRGRTVGMLDADIYGPSMPRMLGTFERPGTRDGKRLEPISAHGLKVMSIGFMVPEDTPTIWRGPMVMSALEQMLRDVEWGALEVLVVDMPPGTGDAQLTMAQRVPLTGAVIVSTPQDIALIDARKGLNMFRRVDVPVLGIVENMSTFICPHCGGRSDIFGHGGAEAEAKRLACDFLGAVPLHIAIRETGDAGTPIVVAAPDSEQAQAFIAIAERVDTKLAALTRSPDRAAPKILMQ